MEEIIEYVKRLQIGEPDNRNNLAIFPILGQDSKLEHIVLSDAIKEGFVISEKGGGTVPILYSVNRTGKKVLAIAGEYVVGGRQNRTLTRSGYFESDFAGDLPVRCIQHGRWSYGAGMGIGGGQEDRARFMAVGHAPISAYAASDQGETWRQVDMMLEESGVDNETRDLHAVYEEKKEEFEKYQDSFLIRDKQIGNLAIISKNDKKIFVVDLFDRHEILGKYHGNLVRSYALEAGLGETRDIETNLEEARSFLERLEACSFTPQKPIGTGRDYIIVGKEVEGNVLLANSVIAYMNLHSKNDGQEARDVMRAATNIFDGPVLDISDSDIEEEGIIGTFRGDEEGIIFDPDV
jgi:hypothetical protein